jgi:hypothetical protein
MLHEGQNISASRGKNGIQNNYKTEMHPPLGNECITVLFVDTGYSRSHRWFFALTPTIIERWAIQVFLHNPEIHEPNLLPHPQSCAGQFAPVHFLPKLK